MTTPAAKKSPAFTVLELLAVLAVIAALAALIVPLAARARASAEEVGCRANLRQLHAGVVAYIADNGRFPRHPGRDDDNNLYSPNDLDPVTSSTEWYTNIYRYVAAGTLHKGSGAVINWPSSSSFWETPNIKDKLSVFYCPSDARKRTGASNAEEYAKAVSAGCTGIYLPSYSWNNRYDAWRSSDKDTKTAMRVGRPAEVLNAAILFIDGRTQAYNPTQYEGSPSAGIVENIRFRHGASGDYDIEAERNGNKTKKEGGHANAVMFDGAIRSFHEGNLPWCGTTIGGVSGNEIWMPW
jgi:type II secretory pathway pseudopilin PulG